MSIAKVSGLGIVAAGGIRTKEALFQKCLRSESLPLTSGLFKNTSSEDDALKNLLPLAFQDLQSRCGLFSAVAMNAAISEAGWSAKDVSDSGFIFASTTSQVDLWEKTLPLYQTSDIDAGLIKKTALHQSLATPANLLTNKLNITGPVLHIASSCSASSQAIAIAAEWIRTKRVKRCLVGSAEIHSQLTEVGFTSLRLLSQTIATPFDKNRKGINLGEASAFLCLEDADLQNSLSPWGYVRGKGLTTDAFHPTAPHPEGFGSERALRKALATANLSSKDVDWIYAHGTGSVANDLSEALAIANVFGREKLVTSTKPIHGHTLATSGALESVLGLMAMKKNIVLPTIGLVTQDEKITVAVAKQALEKEINIFVKNSLGFGGINVAVLFSKQRST